VNKDYNCENLLKFNHVSVVLSCESMQNFEMDLSVVDWVSLNSVPHSKNMVEQYAHSDLEKNMNTCLFSWANGCYFCFVDLEPFRPQQ